MAPKEMIPDTYTSVSPYSPLLVLVLGGKGGSKFTKGNNNNKQDNAEEQGMEENG